MNAALPATDACDYCGLPIPKPWWGTRGGSDSSSRRGPEPFDGGSATSSGAAAPQYCCVGCRFAAQVTRERGEEGAVRWTLAKLGLAIFCTMNVLVFSMALWSEDIYAVEGDRTTAALAGLFRYLSLLFALPVLFLLGRPLGENTWAGLRRGIYSTDLLLLSGVTAAYVYSAVSVFRGGGHLYFEVGCVVLVLVTLGRWFEATGRLRSTAALDALAKLLPATVRVIRDGSEQWLPSKEIRVRDRLRVLAGERFPTDGRIVRGSAAVDEQVLTGESWPVLKQPADEVLGGTLNLDGQVEMEATAVPGEGTFHRLIDAVARARAAKGRYERLADRAATWFLPAVSAVALATLAWHAARTDWEEGILHGLAVVLIACPCALGLATPMAIWSALGRAAHAQVLFQSGEALERLARVRAVCFDKTGTLTTGTPVLVDLFTADEESRQTVLEYAALAASMSTHPLSVVIRDSARAASSRFGLPGDANAAPNHLAAAASGRTLPGQGVVVDGAGGRPAIYLGSRRFLAGEGLQFTETQEAHYDAAAASGKPVVLVGWDGWIRGIFTFQEQLRPEARQAIQHCRDLGLDTVVLTGDHSRRAEEIARELSISVEGDLLPEHKVERVQAMRAARGAVAMVGDGINDAPALVASDVGIALGCGTDVTRDSAAVCLLGNDLLRLPWAIQLARQGVRTIRANLFWAFGYNVVGIALAASGLLNPAFAALFMVGSSLLVVSSSLRLGHFDWPSANELPADSSPARRLPESTPLDRANRETLPQPARNAAARVPSFVSPEVAE